MKPEKVTIVIIKGVMPQQIEDFPVDCPRSAEGSMHISPGTYEITSGELSHLRKHHKDVARKLTVLPAPAPKQKAPHKDTTEPPMPEKPKEAPPKGRPRKSK